MWWHNICLFPPFLILWFWVLFIFILNYPYSDNDFIHFLHNKAGYWHQKEKTFTEWTLVATEIHTINNWLPWWLILTSAWCSSFCCNTSIQSSARWITSSKRFFGDTSSLYESIVDETWMSETETSVLITELLLLYQMCCFYFLPWSISCNKQCFFPK